MPWTRTDCVQERQRFVEEYDSGVWTMSELCERFGVSRKTGYKLLQRYEEEGEAGLVDRSRAPHSCPHRIDSQVEQAILKLKKRFPRFGARKIRWRLEDHYPQLELPARSTIGDVLQRHGLVKKKRRRTKWKHPGAAPVETTAPNQLWTVDFKGQFQTGDGVYCYPLTIVDHYSRYILRCQSLTNVRAKPSMRVFEGLFREVVCRTRFAATTVCRSPPQAFTGCARSTCGGYGSASCISASCPPVPSRTGHTSACTRSSRTRRLVRRPRTVEASNGCSTTSCTTTTTSDRTRRSGARCPRRAGRRHRGRCPTGLPRRSTRVTSWSAVSATTAPSG